MGSMWGGGGRGGGAHGGMGGIGGSGRGFFQEDEIIGSAYDARLMRRLARYVMPYKLLLGVSAVLLIIMSLAQIAPALLARAIIDTAIAPVVRHELDGETGFALLVPLAAMYLGTLVVNAVARYVQAYITAYAGQNAMSDLRVALFRHVEGLSLSFFDRNPVGRLMTRVTNDIDALIMFLQRGAVSIFTSLASLLFVAGAMLFMEWRLALVTFLAVPAIVFETAYFRRMQRESFRAIRLRLARVNAYLNENITGMSVVQLFTRQPQMRAIFDKLNGDLLAANRGQVRAMSMFQPLIMFTRNATTAALLLAGGWLILNGQLSLGTLVAFTLLVERFFMPINDLSERYGLLQDAMASSERIFRLMDTPQEILDPPNPVSLPHVRGEITFDHVSFAYNEDEWVLRDVDFKIAAGESVAIVGATGAGKTSTISIISRFYDVQKGRILLDGVDLRSMRQADVRRHVGVVLQDPFIFAGTIKSNIRLNDESITDEHVRSAARFVNADAFIGKLPKGYDTEVTERGSTLSVGQKQLLAFARAIAFNPEILLVLDEATSSVDTETEHLIQDALQKLMSGRTSIIIAHRLSTIQNVDRIIVLHKGRIAEMGSHRELLARHGVYHRLYELQYRPSEVAGA